MPSDTNNQNDIYKAGLKYYSLPSLGNLLSKKAFAFVFSAFLLIIFGSAARGEFVLFLIVLWKNWDQFKFLPLSTVYKNDYSPITSKQPNFQESSEHNNITIKFNVDNITEPFKNSLDEFLKPYHMQQFYLYVSFGLLASYIMFFGVGGFLQWWFYIRQRNQPEKWKCQPNRFLTTQNERHEFLLGAACLLVAGTISGLTTTYMVNEGPASTIYFNIDDHGWPYFFISTVCLFLMQDAGSYYFHRMLHLPFFYRNFHKWHHRYHSPTAFSAVAMHPLESTIFQLVLLAPMFLIPLHYVTVIGTFNYLYYYGLIDHSGIDMDSIWPWQPPVRFHDDHHRHFHVNFGFNTTIFDRFHNTLRRKDRVYGEDVFYGKGAPLKSKTS